MFFSEYPKLHCAIMCAIVYSGLCDPENKSALQALWCLEQNITGFLLL